MATGGNHNHTATYHYNIATGTNATGSITNDIGNIHRTGDSGNLSLSVTTNASNTGYTGSGTVIDMRTRRLNSIVWKRIS